LAGGGGGSITAIGFPRFVTKTGRPVRFTFSSTARQVALRPLCCTGPIFALGSSWPAPPRTGHIFAFARDKWWAVPTLRDQGKWWAVPTLRDQGKWWAVPTLRDRGKWWAVPTLRACASRTHTRTRTRSRTRNDQIKSMAPRWSAHEANCRVGTAHPTPAYAGHRFTWSAACANHCRDTMELGNTKRYE
jgi:hypothetical protein